MVLDSRGPLPPNWEIAYSESGEKYFIEYVLNFFTSFRKINCILSYLKILILR